MSHYHQAILRKPGENFADGLTTVDLGKPDYALALKQHAGYSLALQRCGLELTILEPDINFPDAVFVEDVAILAGNSAVLTNPGAPTRKGEVSGIQPVIERFFDRTFTILSPGTLDGGDVCDAGDQYFIGISERTNPAGANQLAVFLGNAGYGVSLIDIRNISGILHLKSGLAYLGDNTLVVIDALAEMAEFQRFRRLRIDESENYAVNCVRVNDFVLVADGYPRFQAELIAAGYQPLVIDVSEYQKMDGGLSCLSLRF